MSEYTLYELNFQLLCKKVGFEFNITGQRNTWEFYDENKDYYFIRNTISKQMILIKKM